jgi:hypothetical protein
VVNIRKENENEIFKHNYHAHNYRRHVARYGHGSKFLASRRRKMVPAVILTPAKAALMMSI